MGGDGPLVPFGEAVEVVDRASHQLRRANGALDDARRALQLVREAKGQQVVIFFPNAFRARVQEHPPDNRPAPRWAVSLEPDGQIEAAQHGFVEPRQVVAGEDQRNRRFFQ